MLLRLAKRAWDFLSFIKKNPHKRGCDSFGKAGQEREVKKMHSCGSEIALSNFS